MDTTETIDQDPDIMTAMDRRAREAYAARNPKYVPKEDLLCFKILRFPACGCTVVGNGNLLAPLEIVFCPAHAAPSLTVPEIASAVVGAWAGAAPYEAPDAASVVGHLDTLLAAKVPGFDGDAFWRACGYQERPG